MIVNTGANLRKKAVRDSPNGYKYASYVAQTVARHIVTLGSGTFVSLFVVAEADVMAGWAEGIPGEVEPGGGGEELVGEGVGL